MTAKIMNFHVVTIFPASLDSYLNESIVARAQKNNLIKIQALNPRDFTTDKHHRVDDKPYGGGPGMAMLAEPILQTVEKIKKTAGPKTKTIIFAPGGKQFTNALARQWSKKYSDLILIAGRYEGIDGRVKKILKADLSTKALASVEEISIGPYVLSGGELPALVVIDAVARQIPGVLGNADSPEENRASADDIYTRPETLEWQGKKYRVPKILLSGHHKNIEAWRESKNKKKLK